MREEETLCFILSITGDFLAAIYTGVCKGSPFAAFWRAVWKGHEVVLRDISQGLLPPMGVLCSGGDILISALHWYL